MSATATRVAIIGGGVAGLATAALLADDGYDVDVYEQRPQVGGRAGSWEAEGFRFDTGPSWWLMPEVFDHFYELLGTSTSEQLELLRLDPGYRVFFEGHADPVDVHSDEQRSVELFEKMETGAGHELSEYLASARHAYDIAVRRFLYTNFDTPRAFVDPEVLRHAKTLVQLLGTSLDTFISRRFSDRRLRQILGYPAVFLASSPERAPAMYHLMSWLDLDEGVRYPDGGFTRFVESLASVAQEKCARLHPGTTVTEILTRPTEPSEGRLRRRLSRRRADVAGLRIRGDDSVERTVDADIVIGAADLHHVETRLLPRALQTFPQRWWDRRISGPGAVLVFLGVRGRLPQLQHHSLFFTADWATNFDDIFETPTAVPDPASLYVCTPSRTDESVAPDGHENLFMLIPVPADPELGRGGVDGAGDPVIEQIADRAIELVSSWAGIDDLAERVVVRRTTGPGDFSADLNSWSGGALGPAHTLWQSAFLRANNRSAKVGGLYYAGGTTRPGIGLPMCLISAELIRKRLRGDHSPGPSPV
ncbi:phytoene desaturase family protein [Gordonia otitidis]|uniref:Phytoene desaturase n=1 Tax=Gordonia otitidis (strain DSM 44809 / CCUG 52243 / JCM 12355 / NBRC 100426 / IFM 10032) TaxID=1108044 RepID=H5TTF1_GORO1|nr:phytoene desaturase family protein [Gordonia otitidis]GAB36759.1 phytoene desaturase [Gordonia otitidis NBRC 100426]